MRVRWTRAPLAALLDNAKIGILTGSMLSAILGMMILRFTLPGRSEIPSEASPEAPKA